jgi:hypothetical protein
MININNVINIITCPISLQIFYDPVIANDGHTYEKFVIVEWLKKKKISPITNEKINDNLVTSIMAKYLVDECFKIDPQLKKQQYVISFECAIDDIMSRKKYECLFNYDNIGGQLMIDKNYLTKILCECKDDKIIKHIIDSFDNLECSNNEGWRPIHFICNNSTPEMIKYIVNKGVNLECSDNKGWRPIHFICRYLVPEMIKYIIDKGVNLECYDNEGWRPIHFICRYSVPKMIKYIIDKGVCLNCVTNNNWLPVRFIYNYSTFEMIKYIGNH